MTYVAIAAHEAWQAHGALIETAKPTFGPAIAQRFAHAKTVSGHAAAEAAAHRWRIAAQMADLVGHAGVAILPTAAGAAHLRDAVPATVDAFRIRTLRITSIAGLARLPQVNIPMRGAGAADGSVATWPADRHASDKADVCHKLLMHFRR
jgi:amidase